MTYTDECLNLKIELTPATNKIKVTDFNKEEVQEHEVYSDDFNEIQQDMRVPGFGLGFLLIKIGQAVAKKISGGSSAS